MKEYNTSTIAKEFNIHPNTVRFYEKIGFLPQIPRKENGEFDEALELARKY